MKRILLTGLIGCALTLTTYAATDTAAIWKSKCASCHGADGSGDSKMGRKLRIKDYTDPAVQASFTDEDAFKAMKEGIKDEKGSTRMKPIKDLTDDEIKAMVQHVRSLKK